MSDSGVALIRAVEKRVQRVRTKSLDLSFNELMDMHDSGELVIYPEYQRLFRWSEEKQSRFIESLLLEMPVPPIFAIEQEEGVYELIDGLQRVSSYLHFRGKHPDKKLSDGSPAFLRLIECDIVPELNGADYNELPVALQIKLKRNFVRVEVIRKESDPRLRYYMFKRLNTGGEILSDQEIRNCTIRLLDRKFNDFIIELSQLPDFRECIRCVSEEKIDKKYDQELVLRFFAFKNAREMYRHEVGDFMTEYMEIVADPANTDIVFDYSLEKDVFARTFSVLRSTLGDKAFSRPGRGGELIGTFLSYHYEAFTIGIQDLLGKINPADSLQMDWLRGVFLSIKGDDRFIQLTTGGGKNYPGPLEQRIGFVRARLMEAL